MSANDDLPPHSIARDLARLSAKGRREAISVDDAVRLFADRSAPLLLLFLGLIGFVPSPGLPIGALTGAVVICVAVSMLVRPQRPLIPGFLGRRKLSPKLLRGVMRYAVPFVRRLERWFRPRLTWAVSGLGLALAVIGIAIQAIGLALPLPFGNTPFALGIVLISLGLLTRDGLGTLAGHAVGTASAGAFIWLGIGAVHAGGALGDFMPW